MDRLEGYSQYKLKIRPLTHIIIGSGEHLSACDYVLADFQGGKHLVAFRLPRFLDSISDDDKSELEAAIEENPLAIAKKLNEHSKRIALDSSVHRFTMPITPRAASFIGQRINNKTDAAASELTFRLFQRSAQGPYIPGSSVKGAIRTALTFERSKRFANSRDFRERLEKMVWGFDNPLDDPFRQLKISDSSPVSTQAAIVVFVEFCAGKLERKAQTLREAMMPSRENECHLALSIDNRIVGRGDRGIRPGNELTAPMIVRACKSFYRLVLEKDKEFYSRVTEKGRVNLRWVEQVESAIKDENNGLVFPLKLGLGASNYAKSLGPYFSGRYPVSRKVIDSGAEYCPLGWAVAELARL